MKRRGRAAAIGMMSLCLLSACSGGGSGKTASPATSTTAAAALPQDQQNVSVAIAATVSPGFLGRFQPTARIFDTLANMDDHFHVQPMLAERWETVGTNTYRFHLRAGVKFHDGSPLTADDVKASLDYYVSTKQTTASTLGPDSIRVADPLTVDITPTRTDGRLVEELVHPVHGIFKKGTDPQTAPIGTGPYRFVSYERNVQLVVERFPDYWDQPHAAKLNRITFNSVPDAQTRFLGLRSGTFQVIGDVAPDATAELQAIPKAKVARSVPGASTHLDFNVNGPDPYVLGKDPNVRKAVALAVDRKALVQTVYHDNADVEPLQPDLFGPSTNDVKGPSYDPAQAKQVLAAAGWKPGGDGILTNGARRLALVYVIGFGGGDAAKLTGEVLQSQLKQVGIDLQLTSTLDPGTLQAKTRAGEFDLMWGKGSQTDADPCFLYDLNFASSAIGGTATFLAPGGKVDEEIQACRAATTLEAAQKQAVVVAHQVIDLDYFRIPTGTVREIWGTAGTVTGFRSDPILGRANWEEIYLSVG